MTASPTPESTAAPAAGQFAPTRWTVVLRARGESAEARAALATLCEAYYGPVLRFIRAAGRDEETARDLTQEFFAQLLAGNGLKAVQPGVGRFRSYVLGAVKHFLAETHRRASAAKRGGGQVPVSLDSPSGHETTTELPLPDPASPPSDTLFDHHWAVTLVDRAVAQLAAECAAAGKGVQFRTLKPWLLGDEIGLSPADAARQLDLSPGAVKVAVHRLRKRIRELVQAEIAQTLDDPHQAQDELRYLVEVLARHV